MGKRYEEPTPYRDKRCPECGYYFTARGLNGHIRFLHGESEEEQEKKLRKVLWELGEILIKQGHREVLAFMPKFASNSKVPAEELDKYSKYMKALVENDARSVLKSFNK